MNTKQTICSLVVAAALATGIGFAVKSYNDTVRRENQEFEVRLQVSSELMMLSENLRDDLHLRWSDEDLDLKSEYACKELEVAERSYSQAVESLTANLKKIKPKISQEYINKVIKNFSNFSYADILKEYQAEHNEYCTRGRPHSL